VARRASRDTPLALPPGPPLKLGLDVDAYLAGQRMAGLVIVHDGKLRLERYGLGFDGAGRWTSFSVASRSPPSWWGRRCATATSAAWTTKVSDYIRR